MTSCAATLRDEIGWQLRTRVAAPFAPRIDKVELPQAVGDARLDALLGGGFPLGTLCEVTGPLGSGATALAFSLLAGMSREGACAYLDVSDAGSPHSAAAAGVLLRNVLWVRLSGQKAMAEPAQPMPEPAIAEKHVPDPDQRYWEQGWHVQHNGGSHPRNESKKLGPALERMMSMKDQRRQRKMEGTPGCPNNLFTLAKPLSHHMEWEQFNIRSAEETGPLRRMEQAAAEAAREQAAAKTGLLHADKQEVDATVLGNALSRALRATDKILQAGGFRLVVLDLRLVPPTEARRIPPSTWWRYSKAAAASNSIFLLLSQTACARSSASCVLECEAGLDGGTMRHRVEVLRQRTGTQASRKMPGRVTSWTAAPAWMRAVER